MSIITGGLGGGSGLGTVNVLGAATSGATVAALPQTGLLTQVGILPQTGGMSILLLAAIAVGVSIAVSLIGTKIYTRFN